MLQALHALSFDPHSFLQRRGLGSILQMKKLKPRTTCRCLQATWGACRPRAGLPGPRTRAPVPASSSLGEGVR